MSIPFKQYHSSSIPEGIFHPFKWMTHGNILCFLQKKFKLKFTSFVDPAPKKPQMFDPGLMPFEDDKKTDFNECKTQ